ncbi:MAG: hypothetical protein WCQ89_14560 [Verrucomicrobiota bacterium]|jgi:CDGSH-type Zn-finger protein
MSNTTNETRKKCGCGNTKDPSGFCDGSHANPPPKDTRKKCGCGRTKEPNGYCDGSHAQKP